jgi:hypothetical protein
MPDFVLDIWFRTFDAATAAAKLGEKVQANDGQTGRLTSQVPCHSQHHHRRRLRGAVKAIHRYVLSHHYNGLFCSIVFMFPALVLPTSFAVIHQFFAPIIIGNCAYGLLRPPQRPQSLSTQCRCVEIFNPLLLSHTINDSERISPTSPSWQQWLLTIAKPHSLPAKTAQHRRPLSGGEMRLARCSAMPVAYSLSSMGDLGR